MPKEARTNLAIRGTFCVIFSVFSVAYLRQFCIMAGTRFTSPAEYMTVCIDFYGAWAELVLHACAAQLRHPDSVLALATMPIEGHICAGLFKIIKYHMELCCRCRCLKSTSIVHLRFKLEGVHNPSKLCAWQVIKTARFAFGMQVLSSVLRF